ncbi:hypothetical protein GCM10010531_32380 [Blastococcus jejuensis]|uniref:Uncharacterized protein n=1 Tax=Blastococcus jejuensis TaxID=351224 RepID=A0ABP6PDX4_9ACTN
MRRDSGFTGCSLTEVGSGYAPGRNVHLPFRFPTPFPGGLRPVVIGRNAAVHLPVTRGREPRRVTSSPPVPTVDAATQQRRRLALAATLAGLHVRTALVPPHATRRRQRLQVCGAARVLTALGVRVRVVPPAIPWPRTGGRLLLDRQTPGWLGDLALVTAVPRTTVGWAAVCRRVLPGVAAEPTGGHPDSAICPVSLTYRTDAGPLGRAPRDVQEIVALRGLVVEVHLLQAVDASPVMAA